MRDIQEILKITYMFMIPMIIGVFILAEPILHIFKPEYVVAAPLLRLMCLWAPTGPLLLVSNTIIIGTETVDEGGISVKQILKSRLFKWPLYKYIRSGILLILTYILTYLFFNHFSDQAYLYAAIGCFLARLICGWGFTIFSLKTARKIMLFSFPIINFIKYLSSAGIMAVVVWLLHPLKARDTLLVVGFGAFIYFVLLYIVDSEFRLLFKQVWKELKLTIKIEKKFDNAR